MGYEKQDNCVCIGDWLLYESGLLRENSVTGYGTVKQPPTNLFERSKLIVKFWTIKLDLAVQEFDHRKATLLGSAHIKLGQIANPGGLPCEVDEAVATLKELKMKAESCQRKLNEAQAEMEKNEPVTAAKLRNISEENRERLASFISVVEKIEI